jgi:hypothetical protein
MVFQPGITNHLAKNAIGSGRTTDIAGTDEKNLDHAYQSVLFGKAQEVHFTVTWPHPSGNGLSLLAVIFISTGFAKNLMNVTAS